jgi:sulfoquinovose isomerase
VARLLVQLRTSADDHEGTLLDGAIALFDAATSEGWETSPPGFVYTVDRDGRPVVRDR